MQWQIWQFDEVLPHLSNYLNTEVTHVDLANLSILANLNICPEMHAITRKWQICEISPKIKIRVKMENLKKFRHRANDLKTGIQTKRRFSPSSLDTSESLLRRYPSLELNRSSAKFRQICHFPSNIDLWRSFVKISKFAIACVS